MPQSGNALGYDYPRLGSGWKLESKGAANSIVTDINISWPKSPGVGVNGLVSRIIVWGGMRAFLHEADRAVEQCKEWESRAPRRVSVPSTDDP